MLSLPAIKAVRKAFPDAYIAIMVQPRIDDVLKGNPDIDEVIVYDKNKEHKGALKNFGFMDSKAGREWLLKHQVHLEIVFKNGNKRYIDSNGLSFSRTAGTYERVF